MNIESTTVAEVVEQFPDTAPVFNRYGIDLCCGGDKLVPEAASLHGVDYATLLGQLKEAGAVDEERETILDVRSLAPRERHERIFKTFDDLKAGQAFLLLNDHDPKPLFYQFQAEHAGEVQWTPVEQGPERWAIRIERVGTSEQPTMITLDVRPDIRAGAEPFSKIMSAVASLRPGQSLALINDFEPTPLYNVLGMRGFEHRAEQTPDGAWRIVFSPIS